MSDMLKTTVTSRGFTHFEKPVRDRVGAEVKVYESSAMLPSIWVAAKQDEGNAYGVEDGEVTLHLALDEAEQLRDQLTVLIDDLYEQIGGTFNKEEWEF